MKRRSFLVKAVWVLAGLVTLYALAGVFLVPYLAEREIERFGREDLDRDLEVAGVRFNPFALRLTVEGFRLDERVGDKLAGFDRLVVDFDALSSIAARAWTLSDIDLVGPWLRIERSGEGEINLVRLIEDASGPDPQPESVDDGPPPAVLIRSLSITNGFMSVADYTVSTPADVVVSPIDLTIYNLSTLQHEEGPLLVAANLPAGGVLQWRGDLTLEPLWSEGSVTIDDWRPRNVWPFLRDVVNLEQPGGTVDLEATYRLALSGDEGEVKIENLRLGVHGLELRERGQGEPMLRMDRIELTDTDIDVFGGKVRIGAVEIADGNAVVDVAPDGGVNWGRIAASDSGQTEDAGDPGDPEEASDAEAGTTPAWEIDVTAFRLENLALLAKDRSRAGPLLANVADIDVSLNARLVSGSEGAGGEVNHVRVSILDTAFGPDAAAEPPLTVASVLLDGGNIDLEKSEVAFDAITLSTGRILAWLDREGSLNWERMFASGADVGEGDPGAETGDESPPWKIGADTVRVEGFSVALSDLALEEPHLLTLAPIDATATGVSTDPESEVDFQLDLAIEEGGSLSAAGSVWPLKVSAEADIELKEIALTPAAPYVAGATHMQLESGTVSAASRVRYGKEKAGALSATGSFGLDDLQVIERDTGETLLGWRALSTKGLKFTLDPDDLSIDEVVLDRPTGKFIINEDLTTNWQLALSEPEGGVAAAAAEQEAEPGTGDDSSMPVRVGRIKVVNGFLNFADLSLVPKFRAKIDKLSGSVSGLSTRPGARASGLLEGRVDEFGSAKIEGKLEPLAPENYTDVTMDFRNVEMTSLSPYTIKFAGREIDSGKLSLDLEYRIDKSQLKGDNRIVLDSLTLGDKVESPDAMNLPLNLAVALMKDANDRIDIGLPVSGDLENPEFSYGHLIWKALGNLITNIVASPFRALGAIMGVEGEELEQVLFEAGRSDLPPPSAERLGTVAKALAQRPQLVLEVRGQYNPELDGEALRLEAVRREVATRRGVKLQPGEDPGPVEFTEGKSRRALKKMFIERFSKADYDALKAEVRKRQEQAKNAPQGDTASSEYSPKEMLFKEMFDRLVEGWPLEEDVLKQLADARAAAVQEELTTGGGIPAERIEISESGEGPAGEDGMAVTRLGLTVSK